MQSEQINELATALAKAQGEFPVLEKKSQAYGYKYADLAETLCAIQAPLEKNGLSLSHEIIVVEQGQFLQSTLMHSSGQWLNTKIPLMYRADGKTNAMQAMGSAITYARRYAISCLLNLAADKEIDDDGERAGRPQISPHYVSETVRLPKLKDEQIEWLKQAADRYPDASEFICSKFDISSVEEVAPDQFSYAQTVFTRRAKKEESNGQ